MNRFPNGFLWGAATASYQIEGGGHDDGRVESIWDRFSHTPGKIYKNQTGDVSTDHYHRMPEDVDLMASLGLQAYRFSIAWPRVFTVGVKGLDFYKRLIERLNSRGIKPAATLYHWDLPQALEDAGGWPHRDTAQRFAEYSEMVVKHLDGVAMWMTLNEPWCSAYLGYWTGEHAPGRKTKDFSLALPAAHHLLLGHGLAVQAMRSVRPAAKIGIALNLYPAYPASSSPEDVAAARRMDGFTNRWFLEPVVRARYPSDMPYGDLDFVRRGDLKTIGQPIDFLGINYYFRNRVRADKRSNFLGLRDVRKQPPLTDMGWEIVPQCLYDILIQVKNLTGDLPLYITENGAAFPRVHDPRRVSFLQRHFENAWRAIQDGVPLKGYFVWSFLDNYEWAYGYSKRFGLVYVDYKTQKRTPKTSALWYRDVIARNGL